LEKKITYKDAGVDTVEGQRAVSLMKERVKKTFGPEVLTGLGSFAGLFQPDLTGMKTPVLVSGTDGVGTKLKIAILMDRHDTVGRDLVAMCVNDVLCQGARPLFFLDYIATGHVVAEKIADIVRGVADGCELAGCALIGGETAEMPGFYADGDYDMAGFCVGIVDRDRIIDGSDVAEGDVLVGLASSGLHSNGYSLARKILLDEYGAGIDDTADGLDNIGGTVGEILLTPTRIYTKQVMAALSRVRPHAIVHVTGGGFFENIPRVVPEGLGVDIELGSWDVPRVFRFIQEKAGINDEDVFSTFNMGIGMIFVIPESNTEALTDALAEVGERAYRIGTVVKGEGVVLRGRRA
jgi:phosphoribosylformylglycinamidine cyclo-ligase